MMVFDVSAERIKRIIDHKAYAALTNTAVLTKVAPLLRGREGQVYRRKSGPSQNQLSSTVRFSSIVYLFSSFCRDL